MLLASTTNPVMALFRSPIGASVDACMLEDNRLVAPACESILMDTAERVRVEVERQGAGVVVPRRAVELAIATPGKASR